MRIQTTLFVIVVAFGLPACTIYNEQYYIDLDWVDQNYVTLLDRVMPLANASGTAIAYRSWRDLHPEVPEYYFVIYRDPGTNQLRALVKYPLGRSLRDQLFRLHRKKPASSAVELAALVNMTEFTLTQAACPRLRPLFDAFHTSRVFPPSRVIIIHPPVSQFSFHTLGESGQLEHNTYDHPLVRWASEVRLSLEQCRQSQRSKPNISLLTNRPSGPQPAAASLRRTVSADLQSSGVWRGQQ